MATTRRISTSPTAVQLELALISSDLQFIARLATSEGLGALRPIAFPTLMPFVSSVVMETAGYLRGRGALVRVPPQHEALIRAARLRLKLTDDDRRDFKAILSEAGEVADAASIYVKDLHRGLGAWRRPVQEDLGLYLIAGHLIATTHVMTMNLGVRGVGSPRGPIATDFTLATLGEHMREVGVSVGEFVQSVATALGLDILPLISALPMPTVEDRDGYARQFYRAVGKRLDRSERLASLLVPMLAAQINSGRLLAQPLCDAVGTPLTAFRIRFLNSYHVVSSLQTLLSRHRVSPFLDRSAAVPLQNVLKMPEIRYLRRQHRLRNALMHYTVDSETEQRLRPGTPMDRLCEATAGSRNLVEASLQAVEAAVAGLLGEFLEDGIATTHPARS